MTFFLQLVVNGIVVGSVYALVAMGFVLIYKSSDVINFAQGELLLIGAYLAWSLAQVLPWPLALPLALLLSAFLGPVIERLVLRPLIGEPIISMIMVTIGLSSILRGLMQFIWGVDTLPFPQIFGQEPLHFGEVAVAPVYLWALIIALVLLGLLTLFFRKTVLGIAMRAAADDQQAALSMGISVKRIFAAAWAISAVVSCIGGILLSTINGVQPALTYIGLLVLPVTLVGGLDSLPGAILGGFLIGLVENLSAGYLDPILGNGFKDIAPFLVLMVVMLVRPYGLFGKEIIERV